MRFGPEIKIALALMLACCASLALAGEAGRAKYLGSYPWNMDTPWFGGWSGIELSADGLHMTAITDRGYILKADVHRDAEQIAAIAPRRFWHLKASNGAFLTHKLNDSEGLAVASNGSVHVSFEGVARVARYARPGASAQVLRHHPAFRGFARNKSLEALAIDHRGTLFTIPEALEHGTDIRVFSLENGQWRHRFTLKGGRGFLPVGADFGPDGRLYLLERAWSVLGFRARVRRWDLVDGQPGNEQLLIQTRTGVHDNLEGLAVWRDERGRTRLTMISDDNFLSLQHTEIVEYVVQD